MVDGRPTVRSDCGFALKKGGHWAKFEPKSVSKVEVAEKPDFLMQNVTYFTNKALCKMSCVQRPILYCRRQSSTVV